MLIFNIVLILASFAGGLYLYKFSAGTLKLNKVNIISLFFYIFMLQTSIGSTLIVLGFTKHYTLKYLVFGLGSFYHSFYVTVIAMILMPLIMAAVLKKFKVNPAKEYENYLSKQVNIYEDENSYGIIFIITVICIGLLIGYLIKIGYVPLYKLIFTGDNFNLSTERVRISYIYFINQYITNILILSFIPVLSYIAFSYMLIVKQKKWLILWLVLFVSSVLVKTYKFEKSQIIFYCLVYILIYIFIKGKIKIMPLTLFGASAFAILLFFYWKNGYFTSHSIFDIYNGIIGRTIFTQVGNLSYNFDMFPNIFPFLDGRSFSPTIMKLIGMNPELHLRSGKLLMDFYGSQHVYEGTAGVMNCIFYGEAYANFGWIGTFASIIYVSIFICAVFILKLKMEKNPLTVAFFSWFTIAVVLATQGGIVEFVYNSSWLTIIILFLFIYIANKYFIKSNKFLKELRDKD